MDHLRRDVQTSIDAGLNRADTQEVRHVFQQCSIALLRCRTLQDIQYVQEVVLEIKRIVALYGVHASLEQAVRRLEKIKRN